MRVHTTCSYFWNEREMNEIMNEDRKVGEVVWKGKIKQKSGQSTVHSKNDNGFHFFFAIMLMTAYAIERAYSVDQEVLF